MLCERTASTNGWEVALGEVVLVGPHVAADYFVRGKRVLR